MDKSRQYAQNVVAMSDYQPETGYAAIAQTEAYWEALRAGRVVPKRSDLDPRGLEQALENAFILERISAGIARLRIAGSHLNDLMGMETRGMPLTTFFRPSDRRNVADLLEQVFQMPAVGDLRLHAPAGPGRSELEARMVLMPLKSDLGDVSRILGCLVAKGDLGQPPRRFDVMSLSARPLGQTAHNPGPNSPAPFEHADTDGPEGLSEAGRAFEPEAPKNPHPYLRLIKSED